MFDDNNLQISNNEIEGRIYTIRGVQIVLDRDLAILYNIETRVLKQSVRRNIARFPSDFMFELSDLDIDTMVSQSVIPSKQHFGGAKPFAFTEHGVSMLASILTKNVTKKILLDVDKFNKQYPTLVIKEFNKSHDRFMIIDNIDVYHIGASLKDLGKKWFAFSKMNLGSVEAIVESLNFVV